MNIFLYYPLYVYGSHKDVQDLNRGKPSFCGMRLMYARVISPKVGTMMANIIGKGNCQGNCESLAESYQFPMLKKGGLPGEFWLVINP